ncbi:LIM/homeobox protein LMX-1.2 [Cichlidogyrus casuarinus]|uniref:LIM/homeobox protein LMX-1.2 n=1 Tax=Cichlidogyrus casuarinus TaxID=1844966 RepID=A0ABD2QM58_9PLAT
MKVGGLNPDCPMHAGSDISSSCTCRSSQVFHVACFRCCICQKELQTGSKFAVRGSALFCYEDYSRTLCCDVLQELTSLDYQSDSEDNEDDQMTQSSSVDFSFGSQKAIPTSEEALSPTGDYNSLEEGGSVAEADSDSDNGRNCKRPRTILSASQRRRFKNAFEMNPKPTRKMRENLAKETGLNVRVVQVWFQNQRAKVKKLARRQAQEMQNQAKRANLVDTAPGFRFSGIPLNLPVQCPQENYTTDVAGQFAPNISGMLGGKNGATRESKDKGYNFEKGFAPIFTSLLQPPSPPQPGSTQDPIDKLYSMQESYFTAS